jgi:tRNA(Met) cytidine acetyltransferase
MPAIDINHWMRELLGKLCQSRQRQLVVVQGTQDWCDARFEDLVALALPMRVLSNRPLASDAIPFEKADSCLGDEARLVVLDLFSGFNPDLLCIAAGLVQAGGVLLLLSAPPDEWELAADCYASWQDQSRSREPRFVEYFFSQLVADKCVGQVVTAQSLPAWEPSLPVLQPTVIEHGETAQQSRCLRQIERWLDSAQTGVVLIRAARGRGKSSCLGLLARRLQADYRLLVCASSRHNAAALLRWAPDAEFIAPDRLLQTLPPTDLVIVDEAAMIPLSLLRQISRRYTHVVMATTDGGYEGTGQGFMLRFVAAMEANRLLQLELEDPVRWCRGDYLEAWLNRVLLLDTDTPVADADDVDAQAAELQLIEDPGAREFFPLLQQVYRLLNAAHYRTCPSDLRMLMENPDLVLIIARVAERVVGAALLNHEGGFDAALAEQIFLGKRRPRGHLLAQMLTAQAGIEGFARYRGLRVQRIAVYQAWRRRGIGTRLLERARAFAKERELDYIGASFALDVQGVDFWRQAGFSLAHVSFAAGKSSGNHSLAVLRPLQPAVDDEMSRLSARIAQQLPTWMTQFLQYMEAEQVQALLRYAGYSVVLNHLEQREVEAFAFGNRGFELCFASLQRFAMQRVAESAAAVDPLLIEKAIQNRPWEVLARESLGEGRKQLLKRLRRLVEAELKAC